MYVYTVHSYSNRSRAEKEVLKSVVTFSKEEFLSMAVTVLIIFKTLPALCSLRGLVLIFFPVKFFQWDCFRGLDESLRAVRKPEIKQLLMKHFDSGVMRVCVPMMLLQAFLGTQLGCYLFYVLHAFTIGFLPGYYIVSSMIHSYL